MVVIDYLVGGFNYLEKYEFVNRKVMEGLSHILWKIKNV